jgi:hypothetical protein
MTTPDRGVALQGETPTTPAVRQGQRHGAPGTPTESAGYPRDVRGTMAAIFPWYAKTPRP